MPSISQHIIRRQVLDVEVFGTQADGFELQRRLPELCHAWLTPAFEPVLERAVPSNEHLTIDRLEIDAGILSLDNLERDLVEAVTQALERQLRERVPIAGATGSFGATQRRTEAQSVQEAFLHFLKTGSLPWWFHLPTDKTLEDVIQAAWHGRTGELPGSVRRDTIDAMASSFVRKRLIQQFSADFLTTLLAGLSQEAAAVILEVFAKLGTRGLAAQALGHFSEQSWQAIFALLAAGRPPTARNLVAEYLTSLPDSEQQELTLLLRMRQIRPEARAPDSRSDVGTMIAAHLNSRSDAERQTLTLLERIIRLWPDALPPASEPADRAQLGELLNSPPAAARRTRPEASPAASPAKKATPRNRGSALRARQAPGTDNASGESASRNRLAGSGPKSRNKDLMPGKAARGRDPGTDSRHSADRMPARTNSAEREATIARIDLVEGIFVGCAGVVLLHPFLPQLFEGVGIATEGTLVQPERALCLLHFLATGQRRAPEYDLVLPKLLCGLPLEVPVAATVGLTAAEEEEAVALLEAVIRHWDALGGTSVDGLRGTFLARPGKLSQRHDGDLLLQVEARSFDILLDRLPWGIGAIRLPWMQSILWVEWRL